MNEHKQSIPIGWRWARLADVLSSLESGSRPTGGAIGITEGVPSISAEHMTRSGSFEFSKLRFVPVHFYNRMSRGHIQDNDVLVVKDGATTGKVAFVDTQFPFKKAVVNEHVFVCRPNPDVVEPKYLFFWMWGNEGQAEIRANYQGAAIGGINQSFVDTIGIPVPPLGEQKRIATILNEHMAAIERARVAAEAQLEATKGLPAAYLRAVFSSAEVMKWPHVSIGAISTLVIDGPHVTPSYVPIGIPFLTVRNIVNRQIDLTGVSYVTPKDHADFSRRGKAEPGDILYTKDGTMGIPCVVETDLEFSFFVSVALIKLMRDRADPHFVAFALESPTALQQVEKLGAGAGLKHMVLKSIRALEFPLPPLADQEHIAGVLKERMSSAERTRQAIQEELDAINKLPAALLRRAFNGELEDTNRR